MYQPGTTRLRANTHPYDQGIHRSSTGGPRDSFQRGAKSVLNDVEMDWLRWMDAEGKVLPVPEESAKEAIESLTSMTEHAKAEAERAKAQAERADRLQAERDRLEAARARLRGKAGPE